MKAPNDRFAVPGMRKGETIVLQVFKIHMRVSVPELTVPFDVAKKISLSRSVRGSIS